ncbi:hypothetical protein ES703_21031 [subsurface metagenome]
MGRIKKWWKKKHGTSAVLRMMLKPILFAMLPVLKKMIDLWKIQLLDKIPKVAKKDLEGWLSDQIDNLSGSIIRQIEDSLEVK